MVKVTSVIEHTDNVQLYRSPLFLQYIPTNCLIGATIYLQEERGAQGFKTVFSFGHSEQFPCRKNWGKVTNAVCKLTLKS